MSSAPSLIVIETKEFLGRVKGKKVNFDPSCASQYLTFIGETLNSFSVKNYFVKFSTFYSKIRGFLNVGDQLL